jgi:hypothetical protein
MMDNGGLGGHVRKNLSYRLSSQRIAILHKRMIFDFASSYFYQEPPHPAGTSKPRPGSTVTNIYQKLDKLHHINLTYSEPVMLFFLQYIPRLAPHA